MSSCILFPPYEQRQGGCCQTFSFSSLFAVQQTTRSGIGHRINIGTVTNTLNMIKNIFLQTRRILKISSKTYCLSVDYIVDARTCILQADVVLSSLVLRLFLNKNQNAPRPSEHPPVYFVITTFCILFGFCFSSFFCFFGDVVFSEHSCTTIPFPLCMESTSCVFSSRMMFF